MKTVTKKNNTIRDYLNNSSQIGNSNRNDKTNSHQGINEPEEKVAEEEIDIRHLNYKLEKSAPLQYSANETNNTITDTGVSSSHISNKKIIAAGSGSESASKIIKKLNTVNNSSITNNTSNNEELRAKISNKQRSSSNNNAMRVVNNTVGFSEKNNVASGFKEANKDRKQNMSVMKTESKYLDNEDKISKVDEKKKVPSKITVKSGGKNISTINTSSAPYSKKIAEKQTKFGVTGYSA
eukprot:CAMPEP_0170530240 /NCGR_PEP_ID=MMETSP0209-20121228/43356_1 /TAXON_ID=665100 ORGANISM="Litonotus pictus, Strain P1" /NCGR_SAMPLE_ID=MMETSP0209 /ASSEMBLY_ACC=CAM_ASM_000301 /LENGTH=237 /DNA_ID=CAMNT_0010823111 /DNA_START=441 /DNA_END=1150 /DNA_ORIENTATION=+